LKKFKPPENERKWEKTHIPWEDGKGGRGQKQPRVTTVFNSTGGVSQVSKGGARKPKLTWRIPKKDGQVTKESGEKMNACSLVSSRSICTYPKREAEEKAKRNFGARVQTQGDAHNINGRRRASHPPELKMGAQEKGLCAKGR